MMKGGDIAGFAVIVVVAAIFVLGIFVAGIDHGAKRMREEAVAVGVAEYYLDDDNERQWRWRKP